MKDIALGGGDLVPDAFGGDLALELSKRQQDGPIRGDFGGPPVNNESCPIGHTAIVRSKVAADRALDSQQARARPALTATAEKLAGHKFLMRRFESCRPSQPVSL
jgi:hypothetical protein